VAPNIKKKNRKKLAHARSAAPPREDPAEAVERIVRRRDRLIEAGDICIVHARAAVTLTDQRYVYQLSQKGHGRLPGRFASFEHAVAAGDELARARAVRLFYQPGPGETPHLLKDYRPE
jgi:hypothetical protein